MKVFVVALAALAVAPVAQAADVTMVTRDVALGGSSARTLAGAAPRFNLVALHWQGPGTPFFRTQSVTGRWGRWIAADDDWGRRGRWRKQGTPSWIGPSDAIQYRLRGRVTKLRAYFLWSPLERLSARRLAVAGSPPIIPRAAWGADEEIRRAAPLYADTLRYAIVHHTVNSNSYTAAQSASIVRAIEVYHVEGNGWNDIGYNFLVDKYGQVFEGRYGGIDRNVIGAHSGGFNTGSVGIAVIGNYAKAQISAPAESALEQLLAWRLDVAHVDPLSTVNVASGGNSKFPAGKVVTLRAISGHRDTYLTECPGDALYAALPSIAKDVAALGLPKLYTPLATGKLGGPIRFTARLTAPLPWTVTVTDSTGKLVATGSGAGSTIDWTWDATAARPGSYAWTMAAGATVRPATGTVGAKPTQLMITEVSASPPVTGTVSQISYRLSAAATVTATLVDAQGATVTTLFTQLVPAGPHSFAFSVSASVPDGPYAIRLAAQAADGQQASASIPIQVDRTILDFSAAPAAISPNGDGVQDGVTLYFDLARAATAALTIQRAGKPIVTIVSGAYAAGTPVTATWDGTVAGKSVPDGSYAMALTVGSVARTLPLVVDRRPPKLWALSWRHLRFGLSEPATVTLAVGGKRYVKRAKRAGSVYFWLKAPPRRYTVTATDAAGNVTTLKRS